MNFIFENRKFFFLDNISNMCSLAWCSFAFYFIQSTWFACLFLLSFALIKNILIKNFSKHNQVNIPSFKNILMHICLLIFQVLFLVIINNFLFIYLLVHTVLNLFDYMYSINFLFKLIFFTLQKHIKKFVYIICFI